MDRLHAMKVFTTVVEAGAFARAAEQLHLSTTATSRLVAELEKHLGSQLLQRTTRRLSLTETGRRYYERCRQILADVEEAESLAAAAETQVRGALRLGLPHSFGLGYVAPLLPAFCARHPALQLEVTFSDYLVDLVEEGIDLAVRIAHDLDTKLVARPIAPVRLVACAAPEYLAAQGNPVAPLDLKTHRCLTYSYAADGDTWRFVRDGRVDAVQVKGRLRANNGEMIRLAALAGLGIAVQPSFLVGADLRAGRLVRVFPDWESESATAYVVYLPSSRRSARVQAMYEYLRNAFRPGDPPWDR
jgi:DNA-binding transcriptional LysR family regulator